MPTYSVRITNSDFETEDEYEHPDLETAKEQALKGALQMGADEDVRFPPIPDVSRLGLLSTQSGH
jgi:hypothetical protein